MRIIFLFLFFSQLGYTQFYDDFNDGDFLESPIWYGNIEDFIINLNYQLQLDAADGGSSKIYTEYITNDSMEWGININLYFNPSNSNKLRVYFMIDSVDITIANGYFFEIGENGTNDNIKLYKLSKGEEIILAEGDFGVFAQDPIKTYVKITRNKDGIWELYLKKNQEYFQKELEFNDLEYSFNNAFFLLSLDYTKSRVDKFTFDDIYAIPYKPDLIPPNIVNSKLIDNSKLELIFDKQLDSNSIKNIDNYSIDNITFGIKEVKFIKNSPNIIQLIYNEPFKSGIKYKIKLKGIKDLLGNEIIDKQFTSFFLIENPTVGDLAINEILFNPNTGGSDFIELLNISDKFINIKGLKIDNLLKKKQAKTLKNDFILAKSDYLCISPDTNDIINDYYIPDSVELFQNKLPGFDDDVGNITLSYFDSITNREFVIDSFNYFEEMHSDFITKKDGISLERINPKGSTNDRFNWSSCSSQIGGATPGYKNSSYYKFKDKNEDKIYIINKVLSPNFDGIDDKLLIHYSFEKGAKLSNFYILDAKGRFITQLVNNEVLGVEGVISWDGFVDGIKVPIGIYILYYNILEENGELLKGKKAIVIADYLK